MDASRLPGQQGGVSAHRELSRQERLLRHVPAGPVRHVARHVQRQDACVRHCARGSVFLFPACDRRPVRGRRSQRLVSPDDVHGTRAARADGSRIRWAFLAGMCYLAALHAHLVFVLVAPWFAVYVIVTRLRSGRRDIEGFEAIASGFVAGLVIVVLLRRRLVSSGGACRIGRCGYPCRAVPAH